MNGPTEQPDLLVEATPPTPVVLNTPHARDLLRKRYPAPEWALMEEVAPATGGGTRYADAIAVNLWASRGHAVHGFEIKVSRADWLRELKRPEKAEPLFKHCDYWWVLAPKGIVKEGELPPSWGLLELRANSIAQVVAAPRLEAQPLTRAFFASLMRRGHESLDATAEAKYRQALADARGEMERYRDEEVKRRTRQHDELLASIRKFEAETGLQFNSYSGPPIETIKLAERLQTLSGWRGNKALHRLVDLANGLESAAADVRKVVAETGLREPEVPAA